MSVAGLTACGDKVNVTQPAPDSAVTQVTVTPASQNMNVGDKVTLVATVIAGPQQTNRNVTWTSSDATVASVDNAGVVTANKGGVATIIATSAANPAIKGNAVITVAAQVLATVSIGQINQTKCDLIGGCTSVPAVLNNVANQLDVTLNVDAGTQKISEVDLIMNCGGADTVVQKQTFATADVAPGAEDASAPTTLSFNTAAFNPATGAVAFHNGVCTIKAKAITTSGTQVASGTQQLTLNNTDTVSATISTAPVGSQKASATDAQGLLWKAGTVTVAAVPVIYTGGNVTIASAAVNLINLTADGQSTEGSTPGNLDTLDVVATLANLTPTAGVITATFPKDRSAAGVDSTSVKVLGVQVTTVTSNGDPGPTLTASAATSIRLDNLAPDKTAPTVDLTKFGGSNFWLGKSFVFTTAAHTVDLHGAATDNGGVDNVTFTTQSEPNGSTTWTTFAKVTDLTETSSSAGTGSYNLRLVVCDALNNCTNTSTLTTFGVDLQAPTVATISAPANKQIYNIDSVVPTTAQFQVVDSSATAGVTPSGPLTGQEVLVTVQGLQPGSGTGSKTVCVTGVAQGSTPAVTCKSPVTENEASVPLPAASPSGEYTMTVIGADQAGNQSAATTIQFYIDQAAPTISGGVTIPASITTGTSFSLNAVDDMDVAAGAGGLVYTGFTFFETGTSSANGVAFDNVLTRTGTVSVPLATFFRSIATAIDAAGTQPTGLNIRGVDAAQNESKDTLIAFPAGNLAAAGNPVVASTGASGITGSTLFVSPATQDTNKTVTLSDSLQTATGSTSSPFSQVCFYYQSQQGPTPGSPGAAGPNGAEKTEYVKIGCSGSPTATSGSPRKLNYAITWKIPVAFLGQSLPIIAVGQTSANDAFITGPVTLTVNP